MAIKEYAGGAAATTITAAISSGDTSCIIASSTNWPTSNFWIKIYNPTNLATLEKIKCASRVGSVINFSARGGDGTAPAAHSSGETIEHVWTAEDAREANDHVFDTTNDDHTQYLNVARHDLTSRHVAGTVIPSSATAANLSGDGSGGAASSFSLGDHTHGIGAWSTYTPTISGFSIGSGSLSGKYLRIGKLLSVKIFTTMGAGATFTGLFQFTLPATMSAANLDMGMIAISFGGNSLMGRASCVGDLILPYGPTATVPTLAQLSNAYPAATWASGDSINIFINNIELA